jgi:hypothetical protein
MRIAHLRTRAKRRFWFKPIDRHKQECTGEADCQNIKTGYDGNQIRNLALSGLGR